MSIFVKWSAEWMPFVPTDCFLRFFSKAKKVAQQRTARTSHVVAKEGHKLFSVRQSNFCREKGAFPLEQILDYKSWRLFDLFGNRRASWHTDSAEHLDFFFLYIFFSCFLNFITKKKMCGWSSRETGWAAAVTTAATTHGTGVSDDWLKVHRPWTGVCSGYARPHPAIPLWPRLFFISILETCTCSCRVHMHIYFY